MKMNLLSPLNIPAAKSGEFEIVVEKAPPGREFSTANLRNVMFGGHSNTKVSWPHETRWHFLKEGGGTWMSDLPIEHYQMLRSIRGMRGRVLVGGLGLGLVATLLAQKKAVKEVVVVEKSKDVIKLVARHIERPHVESGKVLRADLLQKIRVVRGDLFNYLKKYDGPPFDHAFYDIWQSDGEGTFFNTVCPLYEASKGKVKHSPVNWNEDIMRGQLLMSLNNRLMFLKPEAIEALEFAAKLPKPWEPTGTIYQDWALPYWKWYKEAKPAEVLVQAAARFYATIYGMWGWEERWERSKQFLA